MLVTGYLTDASSLGSAAMSVYWRGRARNWRRSLRACFKNRPGKGLRARRSGWRGARREHIREKSVTDEQQSQPPRPAARPTGILLKHALSFAGWGRDGRCGSILLSWLAVTPITLKNRAQLQ